MARIRYSVGMKKFADLTNEAKESLMGGDWTKLGQLMDCNFETRKSIYGNECLGQKNLQMIEIARKYGAHCKFPGNIIYINIPTFTYVRPSTVGVPPPFRVSLR